MTFTSLGLSEPLARAVAELGYAAPTPVQRAALPAVLRGGDVWASAQTGSGKTAAFLLPLLQRLAAHAPRSPRPVRALVLVPTRELAAQVLEAAGQYARHLPRPPKTVLAVGGVSANPQMLALRGGADLVVATPGRALDLAEQNALRLGAVETLVLDEADRLLSLGFAEELGRVLALLPAQRQNLLFSATFPPGVQALAARLLREPTRIQVEASEAAPAPDIHQRALAVDTDKRTPLLRHLLATHPWPQVLVFVASRYAADHVTLKLQRAGLSASALHGELSQGARTAALEDFKAKRVRVLVATDVAARGLDVAQLAAVVNYELPRSPTDYLHRIGRTGRAGERGTAVSFVTADTEAHFRLIERRHGLRLERERLPGFEPTEAAAPVLDPQGGVKGKRKSKKDKLREAAAAKPSGPKR
ncbi:DEAD/DEAH box helicase [Aggregicoccus sp. 17bor-14]|uniref:DEAD/DEAH box helicase n=1 Tax=Myxococcaceae TaxID=31 RepID=UPI00129C1E71|nr:MULTISPECIES: DEAD/DEAH box helicase [Myxococcaceae]MBF5045866.1 DEAD/DEAH box helicase [Simulacricoccus sp. 17bor-14]MRI91600.1 DEAD/DEAH box helicase [Aggregicoccus sp. 17bor-14]